MEIINNLDFQSMPGSLTLTVAIINLSFLQSTALSLVKILSWSLKLIHLVIFYSWRFSIDLTRTKIFFINSPTWIAQRTKCQIGAPKIDQSISKRAFELNAAWVDRRYWMKTRRFWKWEWRALFVSVRVARYPACTECDAVQGEQMNSTHSTHALLQIALRPSMKIVSPSRALVDKSRRHIPKSARACEGLRGARAQIEQ